MSVSPESRAFATSRVLFKDLGDEAVLLDLETETYFGLNATGTRLWKLLSTGTTIGEALAIMGDEFDVDHAELDRDVRSLIDELVSLELLRTGHA